jgi:hypothetical protein
VKGLLFDALRSQETLDPTRPAIFQTVSLGTSVNRAAKAHSSCPDSRLDPNSGSLTYANAGHDLPYLYRNGEAEELMARGMPLGLMPGMSYEEKETLLQAGEAALLYSDGLVEAHGPQGDMFGFPRLQALVAEHGEARSLGTLLLYGRGVGAGG